MTFQKACVAELRDLPFCSFLGFLAVDDAIVEVSAQDWSSEVVALFLEDWELRRLALSCHPSLPRNEGCVLGELTSRWALLFHCVHSARVALLWNCQSKKAFLSPSEGCGEKKQKQGGTCHRFLKTDRACRPPSLIEFVVVWTPCAFME